MRGEGRGEGLSGGLAEIGFARTDGKTRLAHLYQSHPLRVLFPEAEVGEPPLAVLATTSGGLVAGDRLAVRVHVAAGAAAHVTAAAAEKVYRSAGATVEVEQHFSIEAGGGLEFLPPETILFEGARLRRRTVVELAPDAGFLGGGITVFGRRARGERFTAGLLREIVEVRREGRLLWGDAVHLDGDVGKTVAHPAGFAGAAAFATLVLAPARGDVRALLEGAREAQAESAGPGLSAGVTIVGGLVIARWLAHDAALLRRAYADLACYLRAAAMGLPRRLPRLWHV
ncbi:MAG TPA: urease accessory protein UreD [Stellaceae bacterium]|nr:urease accessory protein UreD [Stellaceae bacterium]